MKHVLYFLKFFTVISQNLSGNFLQFYYSFFYNLTEYLRCVDLTLVVVQRVKQIKHAAQSEEWLYSHWWKHSVITLFKLDVNADNF